MTRDEVLEVLCRMPEGQFDVVVAKLDVPAEYLSGAQASRAADVVRYLDAQGRLGEVAEVVRARAAVGEAAGGGTTRVSIGRLPPTSAQLFGREKDLAWLDRCWAEGVPVASIVAFGGVGKSALVWNWLQGMQGDGWRGAERVYGWSFYSQGTTDKMTSADEFISAALRWFGDGDPTAGSPWDKGERLAELIMKRRTVLVLDGLEPHQFGPGMEEGRLKDPSLQALVRALGTESTGLCVITTRISVSDLEGCPEEKREREQAYVLSSAGFSLRALGRLPESSGLTRMGFERNVAQKDWNNAAISASHLGELFRSRGGLDEALAYARTSVEFADKSGDAGQPILSRGTLAAALHAMGNQTEAAAHLDDAERMEIGLLVSLPGFHYCDLLLDQSRDVDVLARATRALEFFGERYWLLGRALDHVSLGRAHLLPAQRGAGGDLAQAAAHLKHAVEGLRHAGTQQYLPLSLLARADLHTHTGDLPHARTDLDEALRLATRCGFRLHEADAHLAYARLHLAEPDHAQAREHLTLARNLITATGYHRRDDELARLEGLAAR
jgi:tetratricopeptide (TPR) repeat protein